MSEPDASAAGRPRLLATIIGVDLYDSEGVENLSGAARDARLVYDALRRTRLASTEVSGQLLVSDGETQPTREGILQTLRSVAAEALPSDTVLYIHKLQGFPAFFSLDTSDNVL